MSAEDMDLGAVIATLEAKRAALDTAIASLRALVSSGVSTADGTLVNTTAPFSVSGGGEVPDGAFHGKSMPAAIRLYLEMVRTKKTAREISDGLKKGGLESTSKFFDKIVYSTLDRLRKAGEVVKIGNAWGLPAWFPALMRAGAAAKSAKPRRGRPRKNESKGEVAMSTGPKPKERIVQVLGNQPGMELSLQELAEHLRMEPRAVNMTLVNLVKEKTVQKTLAGKYRLAA